jgi:type II secretory pathway component PulF
MAKRYGKIGVTAVGMFNKDSSWFIPLSSATVLVAVGGIHKKVIFVDGQTEEREHLCLTLSFDHDLVDGAPAARFAKTLTEFIESGKVLQNEFGMLKICRTNDSSISISMRRRSMCSCVIGTYSMQPTISELNYKPEWKVNI